MTFAEILKEIIPYTEKEFITIPLSEEGNFSPNLNMWQFFKTKEDLSRFEGKTFHNENVRVGYSIETIPVISNIEFDVVDGEIMATLNNSGDNNYIARIEISYIEDNIFELLPLAEVAFDIIKFNRGN